MMLPLAKRLEAQRAKAPAKKAEHQDVNRPLRIEALNNFAQALKVLCERQDWNNETTT
jgi:hypothetical protein